MLKPPLKPARLFTTALLCMLWTQQATAGSPRTHRIDIDGDESIYKIHCPSGHGTTLSLYFLKKPVEICTYAKDSYGKPTCRSDWSVDEAAAWACNNAQKR